jgi:hypothetical protein
LWESWLKVFTNNKHEAITSKTQDKGLLEYQKLMEGCFKEFFRILKPGRWITVEFHNSSNAVWIAIQEAIQRAGFVVADVRILDKKQGTFKQVTSASSVKKDLIISAYKPNGGLEEKFELVAGTIDGVWEFVKNHLKHLPVCVEKDGKLEIVSERHDYLLYDRTIAFHVQRGVIVPIGASDFYSGLRAKFPQRDNMFFLSEQVSEYDKKKIQSLGVEQLAFYVNDEKTAIQWLRSQLDNNPQTYSEILPKFLQELLTQAKHEKMPELVEILNENFLKDEKDKYYVPDPNKAIDLEKLRERTLLKEFNEYQQSRTKLKIIRTEAVRSGFKKLWQERNYKEIVDVAKRIDDKVIQEDADLLMYYDNALTMLSGI